MAVRMRVTNYILQPKNCGLKVCGKEIKEHLKSFKEILNFATLDTFLKTTYCWAHGFIMYQVMYVGINTLFVSGAKEFQAWCMYGYSVYTPVPIYDTTSNYNVFGADLLTPLGFLVYFYVVCVLWCVRQNIYLKKKEAELNILMMMEGSIDKNAKMNNKPRSFSVMDKEDWIELFGEEKASDFDRFDVDNSGTITLSEWVAFQNAQTMFRTLDADGDRVITLQEWMVMGKSKDLFMIYDHNGSGTITREECGSLNPNPNPNPYPNPYLNPNPNPYSNPNPNPYTNPNCNVRNLKTPRFIKCALTMLSNTQMIAQ